MGNDSAGKKNTAGLLFANQVSRVPNDIFVIKRRIIAAGLIKKSLSCFWINMESNMIPNICGLIERVDFTGST